MLVSCGDLEEIKLRGRRRLSDVAVFAMIKCCKSLQCSRQLCFPERNPSRLEITKKKSTYTCILYTTKHALCKSRLLRVRVSPSETTMTDVLREDENDMIRRSPGTLAFTPPECCSGVTYHGKVVDTWALGVTLHYIILDFCPFIGECLRDTYDKLVGQAFREALGEGIWLAIVDGEIGNYTNNLGASIVQYRDMKLFHQLLKHGISLDLPWDKVTTLFNHARLLEQLYDTEKASILYRLILFKDWDFLNFIRLVRAMLRSSSAVGVLTIPTSLLLPSFFKRRLHLADTLLSVSSIPENYGKYFNEG